MSKQAEPAGQIENHAGHIIALDPGDILIPEETNVRPWSTSTKRDDKEVQALEELGNSLAQYQIQPIVVAPSAKEGGPRYMVIAGRRRIAAAKLYNLGHDPIKLKAIVDEIGEGKGKSAVMFQHALHENIHRKNLTEMDFAFDCKFVREKMGGKTTAAVTQKVANFFGCSPAKVTEAEKLLSLPEDIQMQVGKGELSGEAARELIKHGKTAEERKEILEKAKQKQKEEEKEPESAETAETMPATAGGVEVHTEAAPVKKGKKARKTKTVKTKHVRAAAREVTGASTKRSRGDILDFFRSQLGPANGYPNGAIHVFCDGFIGWAEGKLSDRKLNVLWDNLVEKTDRGKPEPKSELGPSALKAAGVPRTIKAGSAGRPAPKKKGGKSSKKK